jgi:copper chaperone
VHRSTYLVQGMTCGHCVQAVIAEVARVDGVNEVVVDLPTGRVEVTSAQPLPLDALRAAVDEAGYTLAT